MTDKEKAKAYDEALERAKKFEGKYGGGYAGYIFSELAESEDEDERIRRTLVEYFGPGVQLDFVRGVPIQKIRDWLEKQKESLHISETSKEIADVIEVRSFQRGLEEGRRQEQEKKKEQKPVEWNEKFIADVFEKVGLAKIVREQGNDALTNAVQSAMIELSKVENTEWRDEDERMLSRCVKSIESSKQFADSDTFKKAKDNEIDWLKNRFKSLRPSWKPSEEQMRTLDIVISDYRHACTEGSDKKAEILKSLLEQLKKLM